MKGGVEKFLRLRRRFRSVTVKEQGNSRRSDEPGEVTLRLDWLPEDVLLEVLLYCRLDRPSLKSLSGTNRYFRRLSLPLLYNHAIVRIGHINRVMIKSRHLMEQVRTLELVLLGLHPKRDWTNEFFYIIPHFTRVNTLIIGDALFLSSICMERLLSLPALETVRVETPEAVQITQLPTSLTVQPALRRLKYMDYTLIGPDIPEFSWMEGVSVQLTALTKRCSSTLEYLDAPAWLVRWKELSGFQFPCLRYLYISGPCPPDPSPLFSVLAALTPTLRSLQIRVLGRSLESLPTVTSSLSDGDFNLKSLEILRLSCLALHDKVIPRLPEHTRILSLISYPHPIYPRGDLCGSISAYIPDCKALSYVLRMVRLPSLKILELSFQGVLNCGFLANIASAFPLLVELELHRYDEVGCFHPWNCPSVTLLADSLRALTSLKELRLNLNADDLASRVSDPLVPWANWPPLPTSEVLAQYANRVRTLPTWANIIVDTLSTLERVMFLVPFGSRLYNHRWVCFDAVRLDMTLGGVRTAVARTDLYTRFVEVRPFDSMGIGMEEIGRH